MSNTERKPVSAGYSSLQNIRVVAKTATSPAVHPASSHLPYALRSATASTDGPAGHYRAYKPLPFTRAERRQVTVLFGGLNWRAERVIEGALENMGYRACALPPPERADLLTGREVADIGQCCPTSFTVGNLANFLRGEVARIGAEQVARDYVYLTAGSCGACRFGQYHQSYELALRNLGLESFRMFLLGQDDLSQELARDGGLEVNLPFTLGVIWALIVTDVVQDLEYQTRPYEVHPGETDRVSRECVEYLYEVFRQRPVREGNLRALSWHLMTGYFVRAMREVRRRFDGIEVDRLRVKPLVKITGEFYVQTVEGEPNHNIHRWLEAEGAEVYPAAISIWFDYLLRFAGQKFEDRIGIERGAWLKERAIRLTQWALRWSYARMRGVLNGVPHELPDQYELRRLAAPYFNSRLDGGEGDMLIGKALWAHYRKKAHMICELSPYSCMPNTMSVGAMAAVLGKHPDILYAPIEIKGDAEVHALSRCQMILTEAKKRAQREYEETLERTGLTEQAVRAAIERRPELRRATYRVPHYGAAGMAANLVLHVASGGR
jgi:predicted nucleotide-binding protein (sugar kinase/HSP70/actin superfamily)